MEVTEKLWIPEDVICGYNMDIRDSFDNAKKNHKRLQDFDLKKYKTFCYFLKKYWLFPGLSVQT